MADHRTTWEALGHTFHGREALSGFHEEMRRIELAREQHFRRAVREMESGNRVSAEPDFNAQRARAALALLVVLDDLLSRA